MKASQARAIRTRKERLDEMIARFRLNGYLSASEAARLGHVSAATIGYLCSRGTLEAIRVKNLVFVTRASVLEWITPRPYLDDTTGAVTPRYVKARPDATRPSKDGRRRDKS